jgi:hypothetical protein
MGGSAAAVTFRSCHSGYIFGTLLGEHAGKNLQSDFRSVLPAISKKQMK